MGRICLCDPISRSYTDWQATERSTFRSLRFSRDGKWMVSAQNSGAIIVWDAGTGEVQQEFPGHTYGASAVDFLGDGQRIISTGLEDTVGLWDIDKGREVWRGEFGL